MLGGFLVLAFAFAVAVSRSLQAQIARFLDAARRLGRGDFSTEVPTEGRDEFAELGERVQQDVAPARGAAGRAERERARLQDAMRRIGEAFASNLDRDALLEIVVRDRRSTASAPTGGRASVRAGAGGAAEERRARGRRSRRFDRRHQRRPRRPALETGEPRRGRASTGASALAHPLRGPDGRRRACSA